MSNELNKQQGGILAFIVVGVVLAALLAGGIYLSKNHGRQVALAPTSNTTPVVVNEPKDTGTREPVKTLPQDKTDTKSDQPKTESQPKQDTSHTSSTSTNQPSTQPAPRSVATTGPSHIATTGPADTIVSIIAIAALVGGASAYQRSVSRMRAAALNQQL